MNTLDLQPTAQKYPIFNRKFSRVWCTTMETPKTKMSLRAKPFDFETGKVTPNATPKTLRSSGKSSSKRMTKTPLINQQTPTNPSKLSQKHSLITNENEILCSSEDVANLNEQRNDDLVMESQEQLLQNKETNTDECLAYHNESAKKRSLDSEETPQKSTKKRATRRNTSTPLLSHVEVQSESPTPLKTPSKTISSLRKTKLINEEDFEKSLLQDQIPAPEPEVESSESIEINIATSIVQNVKQQQEEAKDSYNDSSSFPVVSIDELEEQLRMEDELVPEEPLIRDGVAASISFLYKHGFLKVPADFSTSSQIHSKPRSSADYQPSFELNYVDSTGRKLTSKEAYKELCHRFHGNAPGKHKMDKLLRRIATQKSSSNNPIKSSELLKEKLKESKSAYLVIGK